MREFGEPWCHFDIYLTPEVQLYITSIAVQSHGQSVVPKSIGALDPANQDKRKQLGVRPLRRCQRHIRFHGMTESIHAFLYSPEPADERGRLGGSKSLSSDT